MGGIEDRQGVQVTGTVQCWQLPVPPPLAGGPAQLQPRRRGVSPGAHRGGPQQGHGDPPPAWLAAAIRRVMLALAPAWVSPHDLVKLGMESGIEGACSSE